MEGAIFEIIFIILTTIIILLMQTFYSNNLFLAGVIRMQDSDFKHTCSTTLPLLIGNEYIKTEDTEITGAVELLYHNLGITEIRTYPTADFLSDRASQLFPDLGPRMNFYVEVSDEKSGQLSEDPKLTQCEFPIHGILSSGVVTMQMNTRGWYD
jgi:hypothetical protein